MRAEPTLPDYPSNSRCFVHLDARLLPYWHTLFDICPALLKLDPPEGLNLFRSFDLGLSQPAAAGLDVPPQRLPLAARLGVSITD